MADLKIVADYSDLQLLRRELVGVSKDAKASASVFEREFSRVEKTLRASAATSQKYYAEVYKMDSAQKSAAKSASVFEQELKKSDRTASKLADTKDRLAKKYKPLYAQSKLYERSLEEINQANQLGVLTDKQREATIERLNQEFTSGTGVFSTYANGMTKGANRMGVAMQQTGYQVGDFLVQVQSGTNPMVAFGQQATQLVGIMYLLPQATLAAKVGILGLRVSMASLALGLGIAIPLITAIGAAFLRTRSESNSASGGIKSYGDAVKDAKAKLEGFTLANEAANKSLRDTTGVILNRGVIDATLELNNALSSQETARGQSKTGARLRVARAREALALAKETLDSYLKGNAAQDRQAYTTRVINDLQTAQQRIRAENGRQMEANLELERQGFAAATGQVQTLANKTSEYIQSVSSAIEQANSLRDSLGEAAFEALRLAGVDMTKPIEDSSKQAAILAGRLGVSLKTALALKELEATGNSGSGAGYEALSNELQLRAATGMGFVGSKGKTKTKPSGGGAKVADPLAELNKRIALDKKLLGVSQERAAVERAIANSEREYSQAAIDGAVQRLEAYNKEKEALESAAQQQQFIADTLKDSMEDAFMSIVDGTKSAEDAFKDMARMIISELYKVLVVQQMVGSFSSGGGGILGALAPIFGRASGGTVMSNKPYLVGEKGPELIMPQNRGHVMNADLTAKAMGNGSGEVNIVQNFSFAANGDESVKKLIAQAAPQIANMTQKQIIDSRRRGGTMKSTFG